MKKKDFLTKN